MKLKLNNSDPVKTNCGEINQSSLAPALKSVEIEAQLLPFNWLNSVFVSQEEKSPLTFSTDQHCSEDDVLSNPSHQPNAAILPQAVENVFEADHELVEPPQTAW